MKPARVDDTERERLRAALLRERAEVEARLKALGADDPELTVEQAAQALGRGSDTARNIAKVAGRFDSVARRYLVRRSALRRYWIERHGPPLPPGLKR